MRSTKLLLSLGSLAVVLTLPGLAAAQDCKVTSDCPRGFACELPNLTTPTSGCTKDGQCPTDNASSTSPSPSVAGFCRPVDCTTDSDCGTNMVCHTQTYSECSGGSSVAPCAPDTKCAVTVVEPDVCTDHTSSTCAYRWQLPCSAATDCGAGFTCLASVKATCPARAGGSSGSGGETGTKTPPSDGNASGGTASGSSGGMTPGTGAGTGAPDDVAECTTTTSFPGYCQPTATTCAIDTDCPAAWTCQSLPAPGAVDGGGVIGNGGSSGSGGTTRDDVVGPPIDLPLSTSTDPAKACVSPFGDTSGRGGTLTGGKASDPESPPTGGSKESADAAAKPAAGGCAVGGGNDVSWSVAGLALLALVRAGRRRSHVSR